MIKSIIILLTIALLTSCATLGAQEPSGIVCGDSASSAEREANRVALAAAFAASRVVDLPRCRVHTSTTIVLNSVRDLRIIGYSSAVLTDSALQIGIISHDPMLPVLSFTNQTRRVVASNLYLAYSSNAAADVPAILIENSASLRLEHLMLFSSTIYDGIHFNATTPCGDSGPGDVCVVTLVGLQAYGHRGSGVIASGLVTYGALPVIYSVGGPIIAGGYGIAGTAAYKALPYSVIIVEQGYMYLAEYMMKCSANTLCSASDVFFEPSHYGVFAEGPNTRIAITNSKFNIALADNYAVSTEGVMLSSIISGNLFHTLAHDAIFVDTANIAIMGNVFSGPDTLKAVRFGIDGLVGSYESNNARFGGVK